MTTILNCKKLSKHYLLGSVRQSVLDKVDLDIHAGDYVALTGPSGSGKTSLLYLLGALDQPSSGELLFAGHSHHGMADSDFAALRNGNIGFVFQSFNLLSRYDVVRNVALPMSYAGLPERQCRERALWLLEQVGLVDHASKTPLQLSGGQQQRVAIARALANQPRVLLADEPTGALDSRTGAEVMELIDQMQQEHRLTVILVTHEAGLAAHARRRLHCHDGRIHEVA